MRFDSIRPVEHITLKPKHKRKDPLADVNPDNDLIYGKQYFGKPKDLILDAINPAHHRETIKAQNRNNTMVRLRAKLLTIARRAGIPLPPRMEVAGFGKLPIIQPSAPIGRIPALPPDIPVGYSPPILIPPSDGIPSPHISGWSDAQLYAYVADSQNGYLYYLMNGGEPIARLDSILEAHVEYMRNIHDNPPPDVKSPPPTPPQQNPPSSGESTPRRPNDSAGQNTIEDRSPPSGVGNSNRQPLPPPPIPPQAPAPPGSPPSSTDSDPEIVKKNAFNLFQTINKGKGQKNQLDLYHNKGGKVWMKKYIDRYGKPKTPNDVEFLKDAWKSHTKDSGPKDSGGVPNDSAGQNNSGGVETGATNSSGIEPIQSESSTGVRAMTQGGMDDLVDIARAAGVPEEKMKDFTRAYQTARGALYRVGVDKNGLSRDDATNQASERALKIVDNFKIPDPNDSGSKDSAGQNNSGNSNQPPPASDPERLIDPSDPTKTSPQTLSNIEKYMVNQYIEYGIDPDEAVRFVEDLRSSGYGGDFGRSGGGLIHPDPNRPSNEVDAPPGDFDPNGGGVIHPDPNRPSNEVDAPPSDPIDPPQSGQGHPKKPGKGGRTGIPAPGSDPPNPGGGIVEEPIDPNDSDEDEDDKKRPIPFPFPDPRRRPPIPPRRKRDKKEEEEEAKKHRGRTGSGIGFLRPYFYAGGSDILAITEHEKIQEVQDWDLYDYPIPQTEDVDNPLYWQNKRIANARFYRTPYLNVDRPRYIPPPSVRQLDSMQPFMQQAVGRKMSMYDPYERRHMNRVSDRDRTSESELADYKDRARVIYPDITNELIRTDARSASHTVAMRDTSKKTQKTINMVDILLSSS